MATEIITTLLEGGYFRGPPREPEELKKNKIVWVLQGFDSPGTIPSHTIRTIAFNLRQHGIDQRKIDLYAEHSGYRLDWSGAVVKAVKLEKK